MKYISEKITTNISCSGSATAHFVTYYVKLGGVTIYVGRVYADANVTSVEVYLNDILRGYGWSGEYATTTLASLTPNDTNAILTFTIEATDGSTTTSNEIEVYFYNVPVDSTMPSVELGAFHNLLNDRGTLTPTLPNGAYSNAVVPLTAFIKSKKTYAEQCATPLKLTALADGYVWFRNFGGLTTPVYYYSYDEGATWTQFTFTTDRTNKIALAEGESICLACDWDGADGTASLSRRVWFSDVNGSYIYDCAVSGNLLSMMSKDNFESYTSVPNYAFVGFFSSCTKVHNYGLVMPYTSCGTQSFVNLFYNCTQLESTPYIPIASGNYSFYNAFANCSSLSEVYFGGDYVGTTSGKTTSWLNGVSSSGDFYYSNSALDSVARSANTIPTNWNAERLTSAEVQEMSVQCGIGGVTLYLNDEATGVAINGNNRVDNYMINYQANVSVGNVSVVDSNGVSSVVAKVDTECSRYFLYWVTRNGAVQCQAMRGYCKISEDFDRTNVLTEFEETKVVEVDITPTWSLNTGVRNNNEVSIYRDIFSSPRLWLFDTETDRMHDVVVVPNSYEVSTYEGTRDGMNLTFEVKLNKTQKQ